MLTEQQLRERFAPVKCDTQLQFDGYMNRLNLYQSEVNHPYIDRKAGIRQRRASILSQIETAKAELHSLRAELLAIEQEQHEQNRAFHVLKAEMNILNPKSASLPEGNGTAGQ